MSGDHNMRGQCPSCGDAMRKPPKLFSKLGAAHFDNDTEVPSHWVAAVIRGAICEEARLKAEIERKNALILHLAEIIDQFIGDAQ